MLLPWICCGAHPCLSFTGEPSTGPNIQMCFPRAKERRRITSLHLLAWCSPRCCWLFATRTHCWLSGTCPRYFSSNLPSSQSNPSLSGYLGLFFPKCKSLQLEFLKVLLHLFLKPDNGSLNQHNPLTYQTLLFPLCSAPAVFFGLPRMGHSGA